MDHCFIIWSFFYVFWNFKNFLKSVWWWKWHRVVEMTKKYHECRETVDLRYHSLSCRGFCYWSFSDIDWAETICCHWWWSFHLELHFLYKLKSPFWFNSQSWMTLRTPLVKWDSSFQSWAFRFVSFFHMSRSGCLMLGGWESGLLVWVSTEQPSAQRKQNKISIIKELDISSLWIKIQGPEHNDMRIIS